MLDAVLAVDPGGTTGWALWNREDGLAAVGEDDFEHFTRRVDNWSRNMSIRGFSGAIVCERYTIGKGTLEKTRQNTPLEIIGVCRYFALKYGHNFELQSPSDAKSFTTNEKLKRLGWYTRGKQHGNDAVRHLVLYLAKMRILTTELTSDPPIG